MTAAEDIPNLIIGGVTINTELVEKIMTNKLVSLTPPQTSGNWASGPKDTKIVDLLRIEIRYSVRGSVDDGDQAALEAAFNTGGVTTLVWDGASPTANIEKLTITKSSKKENSEKDVMLLLLEGVNL